MLGIRTLMLQEKRENVSFYGYGAKSARKDAYFLHSPCAAAASMAYHLKAEKSERERKKNSFIYGLMPCTAGI